MGVSQELIKGTVVPVVLALLKDRPRYGYEMVQLVNARTNGALDWSEGTLYPVLHKLESDGLVSADKIRHRPVGAPSTAVGLERVSAGWLAKEGPVVIGLTAGASTPNNIVGEVVRTLERLTNP